MKNLERNEINEKVHVFLNTARLVLDLSDQEFSDIFEISHKSIKGIKNNCSKLDLDKFFYILEKLNIGFEAVLKEEVDYKLLLKQYQQNPLEIPEKYSKHAKSVKRTLKNVLDFISNTRGDLYLRCLLKNFQLQKEAFDDESGLINHNFMTDLLFELSERGFDASQIFVMGANSYYCNQNGIVSKLLKDFSCQQSTLEYLAHEMSHLFDKNYEYKILKINEKFCEMKVSQYDEVADQLGKKTLGSEYVDILKAGVISTIPMYAGYTQSNVEIMKSIHDGDEETLYRINFNTKQVVH